MSLVSLIEIRLFRDLHTIIRNGVLCTRSDLLEWKSSPESKNNYVTFEKASTDATHLELLQHTTHCYSSLCIIKDLLDLFVKEGLSEGKVRNFEDNVSIFFPTR